MRRTLQILALILAIGAIGLWTVLGANRGWTRTSEPIKTVDEITGIEGIEYRKKFAPGLELLGCALLGSALVAGVSLFVRAHKQKQEAN